MIKGRKVPRSDEASHRCPLRRTPDVLIPAGPAGLTPRIAFDAVRKELDCWEHAMDVAQRSRKRGG